MIQDAIKKLVEKNDLTFQETEAAIHEIMTGSVSPAMISAFLIALRMKGERVDEIAGAASAMRTAAIPITHSFPAALDTCGTGGDNSGTFNISTTSAFIVAGAGYPVAKHGNKSVSSRCGSADVLQAAGVNITIQPDKVAQCLKDVGIAFLFAPLLHVAMKHAMPVRKELGIRTIFNILGPLTNPASVSCQVVGVYDASLVSTIARVLKKLGTRHAAVVHGQGLDELTITGISNVCILKNGTINTLRIKPSDFGLQKAGLGTIKGGTPADNALILKDILTGTEGPRRDISLMNAALGILIASRAAEDGRAKGLMDAYGLAEESIDSGAALKKLDDLVRYSHS